MKVSIERSPALLLQTFDYLKTPVFVVNGDGLVLSANSTAESVFQLSTAEMAGREFTGFMAPGDALPDLEREPSPAPGKPGAWAEGVSFASCLRRRDGTVFEALVSVVPSGVRGQRLIVINDLSHERRLQQRATQRRKELSIFNTFAKILTSHDDTETIIRESIGMLPSIMGVDAAWIHVADYDGGRPVLRASAGGTDTLESLKEGRPEDCLSGKVFASGRPLLVKRSSEDRRISRQCAGALGLESIAAVPVFIRGRVWGVLAIASRKPSYFTAMDMQILSIMGSQLGAAVENSRLISQLGEKMSQIELINELSGTINSSLSIGTVFRMMASEIKKTIDYDRASLLLYNEKDGNMVIFALTTEMKTIMPRGVKAPLEGTSAGWALRNNRPWINYDLMEETRFHLDGKLLAEGIRSTISIPLYQDKTLGVFNLDSTRPGNYSEKDLDILLPVAKHISIALENALLFDEISREKKEWERTFDAITDMVWIEDVNQRIIRVNKALLSRTGLSVVEVEGMHCCEILHMIGIENTGCLCTETVATGQPSSRELKGTGGGIFHFWAYPLMDEDDRLYAIVHYIKDVTSQKSLEQQLIRADKLASLGTLIAGIAHEINNPLGIIAGYAEALRERAKDGSLQGLREFEDFPEYLETIHKEIFRCKEILGSLLEFARPHKGKARELDINELIKEVLLLVNHKAKRQHRNIEFRLNRDLPKICAEPGSMRQLFMNIIINSIYFTPEGGSIVIRTDLDSPGHRGGRMISVSISDTGSGMPQEITDKIFDPFFSTKPVGEGTGLGLAISHKIVRDHGGTIDVRSEPGKGTTFTVKLPAKAEDG